MKNLHKTCRRRFHYLSHEEIHFLCQSFGVSDQEEAIIIDSYKKKLADKVLSQKHFCSRASLVRIRKVFWRRFESINLVPGLISPKLKTVLQKLTFVFFGYLVWCRFFVFFAGQPVLEQAFFPPKKLQSGKKSWRNFFYYC